MSSTLTKERNATELLNVVAVRHEISISRNTRTWKVRAIIAAHRDDNNGSMVGPGYGPDWKKRIKAEVAAFCANDRLPYVVEKMATTYLVEDQAGVQPGMLRAAE